MTATEYVVEALGGPKVFKICECRRQCSRTGTTGAALWQSLKCRARALQLSLTEDNKRWH